MSKHTFCITPSGLYGATNNKIVSECDIEHSSIPRDALNDDWPINEPKVVVTVCGYRSGRRVSGKVKCVQSQIRILAPDDLVGTCVSWVALADDADEATIQVGRVAKADPTGVFVTPICDFVQLDPQIGCEPWLCSKCVEEMRPPAKKCMRCGTIRHARARATWSTPINVGLSVLPYNVDMVVECQALFGDAANALVDVGCFCNVADTEACVMVAADMRYARYILLPNNHIVQLAPGRVPRAADNVATLLPGAVMYTSSGAGYGACSGRWPAQGVAQLISKLQPEPRLGFK